MYNFRKRNRSATDSVFSHSFFQKGRPDLLDQIIRKTNANYEHNKFVAVLEEGEENFTCQPTESKSRSL